VFFERLLLSLAKAENGEMTREYNQIQKEMSGVPTRKRVQQEQGLSPYQLFESRFQHLCFFNPHENVSSRNKGSAPTSCLNHDSSTCVFSIPITLNTLDTRRYPTRSTIDFPNTSGKSSTIPTFLILIPRISTNIISRGPRLSKTISNPWCLHSAII